MKPIKFLEGLLRVLWVVLAFQARMPIHVLLCLFRLFVCPLGCATNPFATLTFCSVFLYGMLNSYAVSIDITYLVATVSNTT